MSTPDQISFVQESKGEEDQPHNNAEHTNQETMFNLDTKGGGKSRHRKRKHAKRGGKAKSRSRSRSRSKSRSKSKRR